MSRNANAAVFLDRDGTIIEDRGHLREPSEVAFFPETFDALRRLREHFLLFIVTNQVGVAEGIITLADVERINQSIVSALGERGITITDVYVCPHKRADKCPCMKPQPYFLQKAAERYGIDLRASFTVGDHPHDVELARNAGAHGIYVLTGHGRKHVGELPHAAPVASGIAEAAEMILAGRPTAAQKRGRKRAPRSFLPGPMRARQEKRVDAGEVAQVQFPGLFGHS